MEDNIKTENKKGFSTSEALILVVVSLLVGLSMGLLYNHKNVVTKIEKNTNDEYLNEFISNYNYIVENYYEDIDREKLVNSAIAGMMESLDDYSVYIDETQSNNFSITLNGSYEGLGVQIAKNETTGYMIITAIFNNSPASEAELKPGDEIISVNNKLAKDMTPTEFSSMIRNSTEATFNLKILRQNEEIEVTLTRKKVELTSVTSEVYDIEGKKVGYIYVGIFANNTLEQFKKELQKLESENINYLIIDVRSNTGGHLTAVGGMLDLFLNKTQIMYQFEQSGVKTPIYGTGMENKNYEIILLGDEASASASEVLISGLKENFDCILIGKKTYGKGTVQELINLSDGTQYKITTKKWLTPKGNWINETEGIIPDIEVELDSKYFETYDKNDDTQLQAAFDYIRKK